MKIVLEDFNVKVGRKNIFKMTIWTESLHQDSNGNGARGWSFYLSIRRAIKQFVVIVATYHFCQLHIKSIKSNPTSCSQF